MTTSNLPGRGKRMACVLFALLLSPLLAELLLRLDGYRAQATADELQILVDRTLGEQANREAEPNSQKGKQQGKGKKQGKAKAKTRELHPYFGYDQVGGQALFERYVKMHRAEDRAEKFTIMVCGGSVAEIFVGNLHGAAEVLAERLSADERLGGRRVAVQRLARAGYKQPQQLEKLAYFFARGCVPDLVLNFDGLNEVTLGTYNLTAGLHPSFPASTHWQYLVQEGTSHAGMEEPMARLFLAREAFLECANQALEGQRLKSAILGRWSRIRCNQLFDRLLEAESGVSARLAANNARPDAASITAADREAALQETITVWAESSKLMQAMCESRGTLYIHMLQPTLHDPGSKIISPEEFEKGVGKQGMNRNTGRFYGALRARGAELAAEGVNFVDLSRIFEGMDETLYYDRAHVGRAGNLILAERFAQEIQRRL